MGMRKKDNLVRKFNGKAYYRETHFVNKAEANRIAAKGRSRGYLIRIVASSKPNIYGYAVWSRFEDKGI